MKGDIERHGLEGFWKSLSDEEREHIRDVYGRIDRGEPASEESHAGRFLIGVASRCIDFDWARPTGRKVAMHAMKLSQQAGPMQFTALHEVYTVMIRLLWPDRIDYEQRKELIRYCKHHIDVAPVIRTQIRIEQPDIVLLPTHAGYYYRALLAEEEGYIETAMSMAKSGKHSGFSGDWDHILERLTKRT